MTKIFVTGATGYIGGDALEAIVRAHPEYDITCLVRNSDKGAQVAKQFPKVKLVYGDLDSGDVIEEESKKADIVLNFASSDHKPALEAIIRGIAAHDASHPGFLIHTSGTGILLWDDLKDNRFGEDSDKVYNDLEGVSELASFPEQAPHAITDKIVREASAGNAASPIKQAIVCPGTIYGEGRGPGNKRSIQLPALAKATLETGHGVMINAGKTRWNNVHVRDLSDMYLKLTEEAAAGGSTAEWPNKPQVWGPEAYFFCEGGEHVWGEASQWLVEEAYNAGLIKSKEVKSFTLEEAAKFHHYGGLIWGANSRAKARRGREVLKWKPTNPSLRDEIKATLDIEARDLGLKPGHAKVAAGDA